MKKQIFTLLIVLLGLLQSKLTQAQCQASFTASQIQGTTTWQFNNTSTGSITGLYWSFGDSSNVTTAIMSPGANIICLTVWNNNGCQSTVCDTVYLNSNPATCDASFSTQHTGNLFHFYPTSVSSTYDYFWNYGDGTTATGFVNPTHGYVNPGVYMVCLTIVDSNAMCSDYYCDSIVVGNVQNCNAQFSATDSGNNFFFSPALTGSQYDYFWNFGDGSSSTQSHPHHYYTQSGYYTVCLTITDSLSGCMATWCDSLHLNPSNCNAQFSVADSGTIAIFTALSGTPNQYTYLWTFGDGSSSTAYHPVHNYPQPGTYLVCLSVYDMQQTCNASHCDSVYISGGGGVFCNTSFSQQITNHTASFSGSVSPGTASSWHWNFGDGISSALANPSHTYANAGTYNVCLITTNNQGCSSSTCHNITISNSSTCNAGFSVIDSSGHYFIPTVYSQNYDYYWNFGDGTSSTSPYGYHVYNGTGLYIACLTVIDSLNNCTSSHCDSIYVGGVSCHANISHQQSGLTAYLNGWSASNVTTWLWNFGDGSALSTLQNPTHTYANAGTYNVCLITTNNQGCSSSTCHNITISNSSTCNAGFSVIDSSGHYFIPTVYGQNYDYYWNFGDGTSSTSPYGYHVYNGTGLYIACLTVIDSLNNCTSSHCDSIYVGGVSCHANISHQQSGLTAYLNGWSASNVTTWLWNFGDGSALSTLQNPTHTYANAGTYNVCLAIQTANGCADSVCTTVTVTAPNNCNANFYAVPDSSSSNGVVIFIPQIVNQNLYYYWSFGDGSSVSGTMYPSHVYTGNGPWTACLTIIDSVAMCSATHCDTVVNVWTNPSCAASFTASSNSATTGIFTNTSTGNFTNVYWSFGDGTSGTGNTATHTYNTSGVYIVCVTVTGNGCQASHCDSVVIGNGQGNLCTPYFYSYPDSSFGNGVFGFGLLNNCQGYTYTWSANGQVIGSGTGFTYQFADSGWYDICVTATSPNGGTQSNCDSVFVYRFAGTTGISENNNSLPVIASPNPAHDQLTLSFQLNTVDMVSIDIMSMEGKVLMAETESYSYGLNKKVIDTGSFPAGIYLVRLSAGDHQAITRIAVQH